MRDLIFVLWHVIHTQPDEGTVVSFAARLEESVMTI